MNDKDDIMSAFCEIAKSMLDMAESIKMTPKEIEDHVKHGRPLEDILDSQEAMDRESENLKRVLNGLKPKPPMRRETQVNRNIDENYVPTMRQMSPEPDYTVTVVGENDD